MLAAAAQTRIEKGLTCAIDGYPAKSCGDPVKNITVPATDAPVQLEIAAPVGSADSSSAAGSASPNAQPGDDQDADPADNSQAAWVTIVPIAVIVVALGVSGYLLNRRRRRAD